MPTVDTVEAALPTTEQEYAAVCENKNTRNTWKPQKMVGKLTYHFKYLQIFIYWVIKNAKGYKIDENFTRTFCAFMVQKSQQKGVVCIPQKLLLPFFKLFSFFSV